MQLGYAWLQSVCGPRFGFLRCCYPREHVYKVRFSKLRKSGWEEVDCPICFSELSYDDSGVGDTITVSGSMDASLASTFLEGSGSMNRGKKLRTCFQTPCKHYFHQKCLVTWMDVKMECPTCRAALPPY